MKITYIEKLDKFIVTKEEKDTFQDMDCLHRYLRQHFGENVYTIGFNSTFEVVREKKCKKNGISRIAKRSHR